MMAAVAAGSWAMGSAQDHQNQNPSSFGAAQMVSEVPRAFRTVHPIGWTIWKGEILAPTEEELLAGIQG
jgi:hypothetical protein